MVNAFVDDGDVTAKVSTHCPVVRVVENVSKSNRKLHIPEKFIMQHLSFLRNFYVMIFLPWTFLHAMFLMTFKNSLEMSPHLHLMVSQNRNNYQKLCMLC